MDENGQNERFRDHPCTVLSITVHSKTGQEIAGNLERINVGF